MSIQKFNLWPTPIHIIDDFIDNDDIRETLRKEVTIEKKTNIYSQLKASDKYNLTEAQKFLLKLVTPAAINYCVENSINFEELELCDVQKGCIYKYDSSTSNMLHYEPHDDKIENGFLIAIYYINSDYSEDDWVGGELAIYKDNTYDFNTNVPHVINISPKNNRLILFPGYSIHRIKPYFGDTPRTTLVILWSLTGTTTTAKSLIV